jgi:hypothetical protein
LKQSAQRRHPRRMEPAPTEAPTTTGVTELELEFVDAAQNKIGKIL